MEHIPELTDLLHSQQVQKVLGWRGSTQTIESSFRPCIGLPKNHNVGLRVQTLLGQQVGGTIVGSWELSKLLLSFMNTG